MPVRRVDLRFKILGKGMVLQVTVHEVHRRSDQPSTPGVEDFPGGFVGNIWQRKVEDLKANPQSKG
jgi:hypothetical protein